MKKTKELFFDFETYSELDLLIVGGYSYSMHPSTTTLCLACSYGREKILLLAGRSLPDKWVVRFNDSKIIKIAHNLLFDYWIFNHVFSREQGLFYPIGPGVIRIGGPFYIKLKIEHCYDSMASCYYYGYPGALEKVAIALNLTELKFVEGRRAMLELSRLKKENIKDYKKKLALCGKYCLGDISILKKLFDILGYIDDPFEMEIYILSMKMSMEGIGIDLKSVRNILKAFYWFNNNCDSLVKKVTNGKLVRKDLNSHPTFKAYFASKRILLENTQKGTLLDLRPTLKDKNLQKLIDLRINLGKASINKLKIMETMSESSTEKLDHRARGALQYYGSHTGRYAGRGFQPLNLIRETLNDREFAGYLKLCKTIVKKKMPAIKDLSLISDMPKTLRRLIIAKPGYELIRADYGQIEARVIGWLSGDELLINDFLVSEKDSDVYCEFASKIYGYRIIKKNKKERQVGKYAVLGLGFGMGALRFKDLVMEMGGVEISLTEADRIKTLYRFTYIKVKGLWGILERMFRMTIVNKPKKAYTLKLELAGVSLKFGWSKKVNGVYVTLPAGRSLYYPDSQIRNKEIRHLGIYKGNPVLVKTYGGKIAENIVQAIARDIMTFAMKKIPGTILPVHDEIVTERKVSKNNIPEILKKMKTIGVPPWFDKKLIEVDIAKGKRYDK